jgi:FkbM family methyltransferase
MDFPGFSSTIIWRFRIMETALRGQLPGIPLTRLPRLLLTPVTTWGDFTQFVVPIKTDDDNVLYGSPFGTFYGRREDWSSLGVVILEEICRVYELRPVSVERGDVVLDLGANLGTFTRVALDAGAKLVVAFEPDPSNVQCFRRTFHEELAQSRVVLIEAPAWSECTTVHFSGFGLDGMITDSGRAMEAVTVDSVVRNLGLTSVDFIKSDIEGAERQMLAGASETITRFAPDLAISAYHFSDDPQVLKDIATKLQPYRVTWDKGQKRMFCHRP